MTLTKQQHAQAVHSLCIDPEGYRKISSQAHGRMLTRTAKEQLAQAMADANRGPNEAIPDADDSAATRTGVLT